MDGIKSSMEGKQRRIAELEDRKTDVIQSKQQKENRLKESNRLSEEKKKKGLTLCHQSLRNQGDIGWG